ncbi:hypothetical protein H257_00013 [Aphanomyces astaci]|uniref:J domain-containing protein n=1 Tax=Aphanomyces astaci TaxID=112090 RepID=W4H8K3_APHAT|nr:hypothetical protein H257_00013 [Aphanomyces astaci]ETV88375.1 hypothetical protein H257_00013 [Aphanomyces astaci]|eukprot:XP_009820775.1 hypothetical protein H257_00013 [Aphanomyces astaci]
MSVATAYRTLGLAPGASSDEVRVAYKRLALQYHPDKNRAGVDTTEVFQRISAAYKHISDTSQNQHEGGGSMDDGDFDGTVPFDEFMQMFEAMFQNPSMSAFRTKKKAKGKRPGMRRRGGGRPRMDFDDILFAGMSAFGGMQDSQSFFDAMPGESFDDNDDDELSALFEEMARMQRRPTKSKFRSSSRRKAGYTHKAAQTATTTTTNESDESGDATDDAPSTSPTAAIQIGDKVVVAMSRQGTVAFVGNVHYCKGDMVGIVFDEAVGKNNGTIKGVEYFTCAPQHGLMVQLCDVVRV